MSELSLTDIGSAALGALFEDVTPQVEVTDNTEASGSGDTSPSVDAQGNLHGDDGKFVPKSQEEGTVAEPETAPEPVTEPESQGQPEGTPETELSAEDEALVLELDEEILGLIDTKYGGDIGKALSALKDAQSLIGRQGTEVGNLREENEMLQELVQRMASLETRMTPYRNSIDENPAAVVGEVIERATQSGNFDDATYEAAIEAWAAEDPFGAARLDAQVQMAKQMAAQQVMQPQAPPTTLDNEITSLKAKYPDLQQRLPAIEQVAEQRPALASLLNSEDPRARAQALEDLYHLAVGAGSPDTSKAVQRIILQAKVDADRAKSDATVMSASNTTPPPAQVPSANQALTEVLKEQLGLDDSFEIV